MREALSPFRHPPAQLFVDLELLPFRTELLWFGAIQSGNGGIGNAVDLMRGFPREGLTFFGLLKGGGEGLVSISRVGGD